MKDFGSNRSAGVVTLAASTSVVWLVFILHGLPWTGLVWVSLAFSIALWSGTVSTRSIAQVVDDIEAEPVRAIARPVPKVVL